MPDPIFEPASTNPFGLTKGGLFAKPTFVDIDNDGDLDAFVGSGGDSNNPSPQDGNILFYRNTGNASNPEFTFESTNPFGLTNVGGNGDAAPTFVDIDGNGTLDAFIGNANGNTLFYRNTGNPNNPAFATPSTNPFGLRDAGNNAAPTLADIDADGDLDIFIGVLTANANGGLIFFENTGSHSVPAFGSSSPISSSGRPQPFGLNVSTNNTVLTFVDIDGDTDLDVCIGNGTGNLLIYRNTGNASAPTFAAPSTNPFGLGGNVVNGTNVVNGNNAAPTFVDIDGDGDLDLFVGNSAGNILFYRNTPSLAIAATNISQSEGNTGTQDFTFTVTRSGDTQKMSAANWTVTGSGTNPADATDFGGTLPSGTVTFDKDETSKVITVKVSGDSTLEANEGFTVTLLSNPTNATIATATATGTILNDDSILTIAATNASQSEGNTGTKAFTFTVTRSSDPSSISTSSASATWTVTGSGTNPTDAKDFSGTLWGTITFNPTETSKSITVNVLGDSTVEENEQFTVTLSNPTNATITTATATGTILNDDTALAIAATNASQSEGNTETTAFTFTVTRSGDTSGSSSANWTVTGAGTNPADATDFGGTLPSGTVTFNPTETSKSITVNVSGDPTFEQNEEFTVTLSNPTNTTITKATATGTIVNDDSVLAIAATNASQGEGNTETTAFTFTVNRTGNTGSTSSANWTVTGFGSKPADANDFGGTLPAGTVDFAAGETSKTITVNALGDSTVEPDEQFTVTLSNPTNATITTATATGTILNDDTALAIAATNASQREGNTGTKAFTFTVTRSGNTSSSSSANWTITGSGTDPADATDFGETLPSGTVDFANGETSKIITVNVSGDTISEFDEEFTVTLSNPTNTTITTETATGTILNDDTALAIAATNASQSEGNTGTTAFTFTVTRSGNTIGTSSANWEVAGVDNQPNEADFGGTLPSGTVDFANGETSKVITVNVLGDTIGEFDEWFTVTLTNPTNAGIIIETATGTIINDDPALAITNRNGRDWGIVTKTEGNTGTTAFTFTINRTGDTSSSSSANWTVTGSGSNPANATDFGGTLPAGTVNFAAGEISKTITVNVLGDSTVEPDEQFTVNLSNPTNATIITATVTAIIQNDDVALAIAATNASQTEGNTGTKAFTFTVTRSGNTTGTSSANWTVTGSGTNPADATDFGGILPAGKVDFANGETSKSITVNVSGDSTVEPNEQFTVNLSNPTNATITTATVTGTIQNDDQVSGSPPSITSSNSATVLENAPISTVVYTATATDPDGPTNQIRWSLGGANASAFTIGNSNGQVRLKTAADYETASGYSIDVIATDISQLSTAKTVTIGVIDQAVFSINNVTVNENAGTAVFIVTATDPISNSTATVNYATANITAFGSTSSNGDYRSTSGSLSFSTGEASKTISVVIDDDTLYEPTPETFSVRLSNPTNGAIANGTGTGTIIDNDLPLTISIQNSQVVEGNNGTVQLLFPVNLSTLSGQEVKVDYTVSDGTATVVDNDYVSTSGTLRLGAGMLSGTIAITVNGDTKVESDETLTLKLSNPVGATIAQETATGKIVNDDGINGAITLTGTADSDTLSSNPTSTTVPNEIFQGLPGNDRLFGYHGNNIFEGGAGADILTGYASKDIFLYPNLTDSLLNAMDSITRFNWMEGDRVQLLFLPSKLSYVGDITAGSLSAATTQAYATANLGANEAIFFKYGSSYYLSVNNGTAAFTNTADLLIKFGSLLNAPTTAGALTVNNYFQI